MREVDPPYEITTLSDYRRRHASYKLDADLQEAHRQHPWICTWDDHETANNSWSDGAQNHNGGEGDWEDRKSAGRQAYLEWLPIREDAEGRLYRRLLNGDLLDIIVLDTRIEGRDEEPSTTEEAPSTATSNPKDSRRSTARHRVGSASIRRNSPPTRSRLTPSRV